MLFMTQSCDYFSNPNDKMVSILEARYKMYDVKENPFSPEPEVAYFDSIVKISDEAYFKLYNELKKGNAVLKLGKEAESVAIIESVINRKMAMDGKDSPETLKCLAIAYMRLGERQNCVDYHNPESCIIPTEKKRNSYGTTWFTKSD